MQTPSAWSTACVAFLHLGVCVLTVQTLSHRFLSVVYRTKRQTQISRCSAVNITSAAITKKSRLICCGRI